MTASSLRSQAVSVILVDGVLIVPHNRSHLIRERIENIPRCLLVHGLCSLTRDTHEGGAWADTLRAEGIELGGPKRLIGRASIASVTIAMAVGPCKRDSAVRHIRCHTMVFSHSTELSLDPSREVGGPTGDICAC